MYYYFHSKILNYLHPVAIISFGMTTLGGSCHKKARMITPSDAFQLKLANILNIHEHPRRVSPKLGNACQFDATPT